jgi:hypothetical protein
MSVTSGQTATVSISADVNPICEGGTVRFTALVNGSSNPVYQWKLNGSTVGTNSPSFAAIGFNNADQVQCVLTNAVACSGGLPTSNTISILVNSAINPQISIQANKSLVCLQDTVVFSATTSFAGINPSLEWKKNDVLVGTGASYLLPNPATGDIIKCQLNTQVGCQAISNSIAMNVVVCQLGWQDAQELNGWEIFPNPIEDKLFVQHSIHRSGSLIIYNQQGQIVLQTNIEWNQAIATDFLNKGMYLLEIKSGDRSWMSKIVKM